MSEMSGDVLLHLPWPLILLSLMVCCGGDWAVGAIHGQGHRWAWLRAVLDSSTHGLVALVSWYVVTWPVLHWSQSLVCGLVGAAIDLDHVLAAGSFDIDLITHLTRRPPLHATTPWLLLLFPLLLSSSRSVRVTCALLLTSVLTHHARDALRRGLWLPPCGSTPPLPRPLYLGLEAVLPLAIAALLGRNYTSSLAASIGLHSSPGIVQTV